MNVVSLLGESRTKEVEAGGLWWRIRPVTSADLALAGRVALLAAPAGGEAEEVDADADPADQIAQVRRMVGKISPGDLKQIKETQGALVCASVTHVQHPESGEWEKITISDRAENDPKRAILNIRYLPPGAEDALAGEIMALSVGGGWDAALATFRGEPAPASSARPDRAAQGVDRV